MLVNKRHAYSTRALRLVKQPNFGVQTLHNGFFFVSSLFQYKPFREESQHPKRRGCPGLLSFNLVFQDQVEDETDNAHDQRA